MSGVTPPVSLNIYTLLHGYPCRLNFCWIKESTILSCRSNCIGYGLKQIDKQKALSIQQSQYTYFPFSSSLLAIHTLEKNNKKSKKLWWACAENCVPEVT